jgi:DNA-binding LytR/AlgR family response regulator
MSTYLQFNTRDDYYRVPVNRIVFFVADKNYTILQLTNGKTLMFTFSLQKMQDYIVASLGAAARNFARVGRSHIVNLSYVYHIDITKQRLVLFAEAESLEYTIPVSKEALRSLRTIFVKPENKSIIEA